MPHMQLNWEAQEAAKVLTPLRSKPTQTTSIVITSMTPPSSPSRLAALPNELLEHITYALWEDAQGVKNFHRLSSRVFTATIYVFRQRFLAERAVHYDEGSLRRLVKISKDPILGPHVRQLHVSTLYLDKRATEPESARKSRSKLMKLWRAITRWTRSDPPTVHRRLARSQKRLRHKDLGAVLLTQAMKNLTRLESLHIFDDWSCLRPTVFHQEQEWLQPLVEYMQQDGRPSITVTPRYRTHARKVVAAVLEAVAASPVRLRTFSTSFDAYTSYLTDATGRYVDSTKPLKAFSSLTSIALDIRDGHHSDFLLRRILATSDSLLHISLNCWQTYQIQGLCESTLQSTNLTKLTSLALTNMEVSADSICDILQRTTSLQVLSLENVKLFHIQPSTDLEAWPTVLVAILELTTLHHLHIIRPLDAAGIVAFRPNKINAAERELHTGQFTRRPGGLIFTIPGGVDAISRHIYHISFNQANFPGCDLSVRFNDWSSVRYKHRHERGDWVCLDSAETIQRFLPMFIRKYRVKHLTCDLTLQYRRRGIYNWATAQVALDTDDDSDSED